jgi:hypothetical protein
MRDIKLIRDGIRSNLNRPLKLIKYQNKLKSLVGQDFYNLIYPSILSNIKLIESVKNIM